MTEKSHVSLAQHQCFICGSLFDTGEVLLDKRLRATLEPKTVTGLGVCEKCKAQIADGFVAILEANCTGEQTGRSLFLRASVFSDIFNQPAPDRGICKAPIQVFNELVGLHEKSAAQIKNS